MVLVYIYLPKGSKYLYISLNISIFLPRAGNSVYKCNNRFPNSHFLILLYSISLSAQVYVQIQSDDPLYPPQRVMSATTVLFLHTQGYVPSCSVILTQIVMSPTAVLSLHTQGYVPYCSVIPT